MDSGVPITQPSTWRVRLNHDRRPEAAAARSAYNAMVRCEPSYYDTSGHEAYALSREQAASALWAWRKSEWLSSRGGAFS